MNSKTGLADVIGKGRPKEGRRILRSHVEGCIGPQHNPAGAQNLNEIVQFRRSMHKRVYIHLAQQGKRRRWQMCQFGPYLRSVFPSPNDERSNATAVGGNEADMWEALEDATKSEAGQCNSCFSGIAEQIA